MIGDDVKRVKIRSIIALLCLYRGQFANNALAADQEPRGFLGWLPAINVPCSVNVRASGQGRFLAAEARR